MNLASSFNIRVYGLLLNSKNEVLLTDEYRMNMLMSKFPGGGLEYGEGTIDCLKREFREELGIEIDVESHFYTTDYFQKAYFFENTQLISIYYLVRSKEMDKISTTTKKFELAPIEGKQTFRWVNLKTLNEGELSFPIDKKVVQLLKQKL